MAPAAWARIIGFFCAFALAGLALAAVVLILLPRLRSLVDGLLLSLVAMILTASLATWLEPVTTPLGMAVVNGPVLLLILGYVLTFLPFVRRRCARQEKTARAEFLLPQQPAEVWRALRPGPGHPELYWQPNLRTAEVDADDPAQLHLTFQRRLGRVEPMDVRLIEDRPSERLRYAFNTPESAARRCSGCGNFSATLSPADAGGTRLAVEIRRAGLTPMALAVGWLDGGGTDTLLALKTRLSGARDWSLMGRSLRRDAKG